MFTSLLPAVGFVFSVPFVLQLPFYCNANHVLFIFLISLPFSPPSLLSDSNLHRFPSFFLDYDFGDIFPVLQSLPSADWEGGTLVNPSPFLSTPPPLPCHGLPSCLLHAGYFKAATNESKRSWLSGSGLSRKVVIQLDFLCYLIYLSSVSKA